MQIPVVFCHMPPKKRRLISLQTTDIRMEHTRINCNITRSQFLKKKIAEELTLVKRLILLHPKRTTRGKQILDRQRNSFTVLLVYFKFKNDSNPFLFLHLISLVLCWLVADICMFKYQFLGTGALPHYQQKML
jgi:hypothetical protein